VGEKNSLCFRGNQLDTSHSRVVGALVFILCFCLTAQGVLATSIVVVRTDSGIIIAADSKITHPGTTAGSGVICKIHPARNFVWVSEGHYREDGAGFNLPSLVKTVDVNGALADRMKAFEAIAKAPLREELLNIRRVNPQYFQAMLKRTHSFELAFIRVDDVPHWVSVTYQLRLSSAGKVISTPNLMECPGKGCPPGESVLEMGSQNAMNKWMGEFKNGAHSPTDAADMARILINLEIADEPDHDGPPVQILEITRTGLRCHAVQGKTNEAEPSAAWTGGRWGSSSEHVTVRLRDYLPTRRPRSLLTRAGFSRETGPLFRDLARLSI
jgi:hypothetical protein